MSQHRGSTTERGYGTEHQRLREREAPRVATGAERLKQVRLMMDTLGLTPKGKQDRRWRLRVDAEVADLERERGKRRRRNVRAV